MKASELTTTLPLTDILAHAELGTPDITPPELVTHITTIALTSPETEIPEEPANEFTNWIHQQQVIQELAAEAHQKLEEKAPLPTPEEVIQQTCDWPEWAFTWWGTTIKFPWAGRLAEATAAAWEWLDGQP